MAKPMNSSGSSAFSFQQDQTPDWGTGIDVFEIGNAKGFEQTYNMTLHVFRTPQEKTHWSVGSVWVAPRRLSARGRWTCARVSIRWPGNTKGVRRSGVVRAGTTPDSLSTALTP